MFHFFTFSRGKFNQGLLPVTAVITTQSPFRCAQRNSRTKWEVRCKQQLSFFFIFV